MKVASPPASRTSCSLARPNSGLSSAMTTLAPSRVKSRAASRAMPEPAPVMNATFPCSRFMAYPPSLSSFRYLPRPHHPVFFGNERHQASRGDELRPVRPRLFHVRFRLERLLHRRQVG